MIWDFTFKRVQVLNTLHYKTQIHCLLFNFDQKFFANFFQDKDNTFSPSDLSLP